MSACAPRATTSPRDRAMNWSASSLAKSKSRLLYAYVAKQYPTAMNVSAPVGALSAAEVGMDKGAAELVAMFK